MFWLKKRNKKSSLSMEQLSLILIAVLLGLILLGILIWKQSIKFQPGRLV